MSKAMKSSVRLLALVLLLLVPVAITNRYALNVIIMAGIWVLLASSINLMLGYAGQLPLGHTAFYGLGGYVSGLLSVKLGLSMWLGMPIAGLFTMLIGGIIGKLTFRVRGSAFVLVTLGFGEVLRLVVNNWMGLTNGPLGLSGIQPPMLFGKAFGYVGYYYLVLALNVLAIYIIWRIVRSRFGRAFLALNENEPLANAVGVHSERFLNLAMMVSTLFAGIAGSFYAHYALFISPDMLFFSNTVTMVVMVVVGGKRTIWGPIVGAVLFTLIPEWLRFMENYRVLVYGLILMLSILFMKNGIVPSLAGALRRKKVDGQ
ncbi:MAG: branched-chain amino acid ABC transporter permease [Bacillota bacterium]